MVGHSLGFHPSYQRPANSAVSTIGACSARGDLCAGVLHPGFGLHFLLQSDSFWVCNAGVHHYSVVDHCGGDPTSGQPEALANFQFSWSLSLAYMVLTWTYRKSS